MAYRAAVKMRGMAHLETYISVKQSRLTRGRFVNPVRVTLAKLAVHGLIRTQWDDMRVHISRSRERSYDRK